MTMKLELVPIPVSDVEASLAFYTHKVGFQLDHDVQPGNGMRVIQLTPPGSACSIVFGTGMGEGAVPGTVRNVFFADPDGNSWALQEMPPKH